MKIVIITGQTGTGKTKLASEYAKKYNGELINCDSRQIYKHLDIITGKDYPKNTKIWLYDVVDPKQYFSSYDYVKLALPLIKKMLKKDKTPIIVGGTYFYLKHLLYGIETENIPPNWPLRQQLTRKSIPQLQKLAIQLNIKLNQSDFNNPQRLIRKIEITSCMSLRSLPGPALGGLMYPHHDRGQNTFIGIKNLDIQFIGLKFKNKDKLRQEITKRVEERLKKGAINEVKKLLSLGYNEKDPGLKTIGYQQIIAYLKGKLTKQEAIQQWITKEIQYAKRQYTFMKKDPNIVWKTLAYYHL
jgi:tRNA dimethylallyltransferase